MAKGKPEMDELQDEAANHLAMIEQARKVAEMRGMDV